MKKEYYSRYFSEFLELIDRKALVNKDFRNELKSGDQNRIKKAIADLIASKFEDKKEEENEKERIKSVFDNVDIVVHEDTMKAIHIVLSPGYTNDGPY